MKNINELMLMKALFNTNAPKTKITRSYRKGRRYRVQQVKDRNGFVVKTIVHDMFLSR